MVKLLGNIVLGIGVAGGGYYLYKKYGYKHRQLMAATAGGILGEQLGYMAGSPYGKVVAIGSSITAGVVGFYVGKKLAEPQLTEGGEND